MKSGKTYSEILLQCSTAVFENRTQPLSQTQKTPTQTFPSVTVATGNGGDQSGLESGAGGGNSG